MAKITGVCVGESLVGDGNEVYFLAREAVQSRRPIASGLPTTRTASPPSSPWSRRT